MVVVVGGRGAVAVAHTLTRSLSRVLLDETTDAADDGLVLILLLDFVQRVCSVPAHARAPHASMSALDVSLARNEKAREQAPSGRRMGDARTHVVSTPGALIDPSFNRSRPSGSRRVACGGRSSSFGMFASR